MCLVAYIASNIPLPLILWDKNEPAFHVAELSTEEDQKVRVQFSKPHIYYLGSHEGCGCGFPYTDSLGNEEDKDKTQQTRERLVEYLRSALKTQEDVELFFCWEGDQDAEVESRRTLNLQEMGDAFGFETKQLLKIVKQTA